MVWPLDTNLIFVIGVDLDLGQAGIVGQGHRLKVKVKGQKSCFGITVILLQVQRSGSRSKVEIKVIGQGQGQTFGSQQSILGARPSVAKSNKSHYQSRVFVHVYVICVYAVDWLLITSCGSRSGNVFCPVRVCVCLCVCLSV